MSVYSTDDLTALSGVKEGLVLIGRDRIVRFGEGSVKIVGCRVGLDKKVGGSGKSGAILPS